MADIVISMLEKKKKKENESKTLIDLSKVI